MAALLLDPISGALVTIPHYQWGYTDGYEYVTRDYGKTPHDVWYRERIPYTRRLLTIRVVATDVVVEALRELSILAQRHGDRVQFIPDEADMGTYWWLDWQPETAWRRVIENREEVELELREQVA